MTFREMLAQPVFRRSGWAWDDIARIEVENVSGLKTLGGIALGSTLLGLIAIPALLAVTPAANAPSRPSTSRAGYRLTDASLHTPSPRGAWSATPAPAASLHAPSMFSTRAVVSAWLRPHVVLDGSAALAGDHIASGIVARLRIGELIELGGGMRTSLVRFDDAWRRSTQGLFTGNVHLPIDAARRFALLVGVEAGGGGAIALDVKVPSLGLRYASSSGRVFASLSPAAPQYLRRDDAPGRWSLASTAELGLSF